MATESILPLTINHSSLKNDTVVGNNDDHFTTSLNDGPTDPLIDLDSILLSSDFQATDTLLSGLLATDDDFLNEFLNPSGFNNNNTVDTLSPTTTTTTAYPYIQPYDHTSSPPSYLYSTGSGSSLTADNHSPISSEGFYSPSWGSTTTSGGLRGVAHTPPTSHTPPITNSYSPPPQEPSTTGQIGDVHIDVDMNEEDEEEEGEGTVSSSTSAERKTGSLMLSEEEKRLLAEEGIHLPTDMPLTKAEERHLKRIRRKIKNKHSAAESRKRKREYVDGLEKRVEKCTADNLAYKKKIETLESENKSLMSQLHKLQAIVSQYSPNKIQAGSFLMVLMFSFSILVFPSLLSPQYDIVTTGTSRTLLNVHTDDFGNIIDPVTGQIISDTTPVPLPPWKHQSPVIKTYRHLTPPIPSKDL